MIPATCTRFAPLTAETAPEASRRLVAASAGQFGFVPSPVAKAARSPALLRHMLSGFRALEESSLSELEREVVALTVAYENECGYCMALHTAKLAKLPAGSAVAGALRSGMPLEIRRLEAIRGLSLSLLRDRGHVSEALWEESRAAGLDEEQVLDVALGVGVYALSTVTNTLTAATLDAPFAPFAWTKPRPGELTERGRSFDCPSSEPLR